MTAVYIFGISGIVIILILVTKRLEDKRNKSFLITNIISKGDSRIRNLYNKAVHFYSDSKGHASFFFEKQMPIHSRNFLNKLSSFLKDKRERYIGNMRDSRLLKKPDGISEFFKNMSDIEKGNGEIHDTYEGSFQDDQNEVE